jgi:5'-3' exonuclease
MKKKRLYLIDGSGYMYRAFHAIRYLTNSKGLPTNAVFGFTRMLVNGMIFSKIIKPTAPKPLRNWCNKSPISSR